MAVGGIGLGGFLEGLAGGMEAGRDRALRERAQRLQEATQSAQLGAQGLEVDSETGQVRPSAISADSPLLKVLGQNAKINENGTYTPGSVAEAAGLSAALKQGLEQATPNLFAAPLPEDQKEAFRKAYGYEVPAGYKGKDLTSAIEQARHSRALEATAQGNQEIRRLLAESKIEKGDSPKDLKKDQSDAAAYGRRIEQAERDMQNLARSGYDPTTKVSSLSRLLPEFIKPEQAKLQDQAERNFVNAVLRRESGAAISQSEFDSASKQYFPRVGDTPAVLEQKRLNRLQALEGLKAAAGRAWQSVPQVLDTSRPKQVIGADGNTYQLNPATGKYRRI